MPRPLPIKIPPLKAAVELPLGAMATYPGAVAMIGRDGAPYAITGGAPAIIEALRLAGSWPDLAASAVRTIEDGVAAVEIFGHGGAEQEIEVTFLPVTGGAEVVFLAFLITADAPAGMFVMSEIGLGVPLAALDIVMDRAVHQSCAASSHGA